MSNGQLTTVLYHISRLVAPAEVRQQSDRELLARFVARQDQAAFLVLARKARSIRKRDSLASWLHGVAYRSALSLQRALARNGAREKPLTDVAQPDCADDLTWREMMRVLDLEVERLPENLRA